MPDDDLTARPEHPRDLRGECARVGEAFEQVVGIDDIDPSVGERQALAQVVATVPPGRASRERTRNEPVSRAET